MVGGGVDRDAIQQDDLCGGGEEDAAQAGLQIGVWLRGAAAEEEGEGEPVADRAVINGVGEGPVEIGHRGRLGGEGMIKCAEIHVGEDTGLAGEGAAGGVAGDIAHRGVFDGRNCGEWWGQGADGRERKS